jgi:uncharacterized membrane protein
MKILGLIMAVVGWLIAVSSTQLSSPPIQVLVALIGFVVAIVAVVGVLNSAHLKNAIWKS